MGVRSRSSWPSPAKQTTNPGSAAPAYSMVIIEMCETVLLGALGPNVRVYLRFNGKQIGGQKAHYILRRIDNW